MATPDKVEAHVRDWLGDERQETLTAYVRVMTKSMVNTASPLVENVSVADLRLPAQALGRDLEDMTWVPGSAWALVVSPGSFRVLRLSGWKERVKSAHAEVPLDAVVVHHLDHGSDNGLGIRYFVVDLPDGTWLADSHVHTKKDGEPTPWAQPSDDFIAALGHRAKAIE